MSNDTNNGGSTDYYKLPPRAKDLQDLIEAKEMSFSRGNIFKAAYALNERGNRLRDLYKIRWFANRMIEKEKKDASS